MKSDINKIQSIDVLELFTEILGSKVEEYDLPPPSFEIMQCCILDFSEEEKYILVRMPVLSSWQNPYQTMQGGLIVGAIDNAVGPLSMLIAPFNMTRHIESKLTKAITMDIDYIYVRAELVEQKKRRLTFNVSVKDKHDIVYATATIVNYIMDES